MKTAENSQGQGLRQAGRLQQLQKVGVTKGECQSQLGRKVFVRTVHFLLRVVGLLEQNDMGMTGMESQFSHCCSQNTQQKQPEGGRGFISFRVSDLVHPSKENQAEGATWFIVRGSRKQNWGYWGSTGPLLSHFWRGMTHIQSGSSLSAILSGNSQAHPEMFLTSPPGILEPGMLIISGHHKEAEATD